MFQYLQQWLQIEGGRPHWGLNWDFNFSKHTLRKLYPKFDKWVQAYHFFNSKGTFANELTKKMGV